MEYENKACTCFIHIEIDKKILATIFFAGLPTAYNFLLI